MCTVWPRRSGPGPQTPFVDDPAVAASAASRRHAEALERVVAHVPMSKALACGGAALECAQTPSLRPI